MKEWTTRVANLRKSLEIGQGRCGKSQGVPKTHQHIKIVCEKKLENKKKSEIPKSEIDFVEGYIFPRGDRLFL